MQSCDDRSGNVRDVGKHPRTNALRDFADAFKVDDAWIGRRAAHQQFWLVFFGKPLKFVIIDRLSFARHAIVKNFVAQAGKVKRMTEIGRDTSELQSHSFISYA